MKTEIYEKRTSSYDDLSCRWNSCLWFYFYASPSTTQTKKTDDCVAAATSIPLVNTTTGMGMTAAIAECE